MNRKKSPVNLISTPQGLGITDGNQVLVGDFNKLSKRITAISKEPLVKAVKIKGIEPKDLLVMDGTAGLGEDSFLLAAAGYNVILYEANLTIGKLLEDALLRGKEDAYISDIVSRMELRLEDSLLAMENIAKQENKSMSFRRPDIIFLDPMFPKRRKSSLVKKKLQLFQDLEKPCKDENAMIMAAIKLKPQKIVVKRGIKGQFLGGHKPTYSIFGKKIRYDCIVL